MDECPVCALRMDCEARSCERLWSALPQFYEIDFILIVSQLLPVHVNAHFENGGLEANGEPRKCQVQV